MPSYSIDITYAFAQLGLETDVSRAEIDEVLANAAAYRFSTRDRIELVRRLVGFFAARGTFGAPEDSFEDIRKAYYRQAMQLHPDRNRDNAHAEEQLKAINAAYAAVESVHREARDYFSLSEHARREIEKEACEATESERPEGAKSHARGGHTRHKAEHEFRRAHHEETHAHDSPKRPVIRYMAASIPRFIRTAKLGYLRLDSVIGSWYIAAENDLNYVFDVIMLPEREFLRARLYLGLPDSATPTLARTRFLPAYVPQDVKTLVVPPGEPDAAAFAKNYFLEVFGLDAWKT